MKLLVLERQEHSDKSIIGSFYIDGDFECYSLELPWRDNQRSISCIPSGIYKLVPHKYKGKTNTFALVNDDLKIHHYEQGDSKRSTILIHYGNKPEDIDGCILTGKEKLTDEVRNSKAALIDLVKKIKKLGITEIEIR